MHKMIGLKEFFLYITNSYKIRIPKTPKSLCPQDHIKVVAQPVILSRTMDVIVERISDISRVIAGKWYAAFLKGEIYHEVWIFDQVWVLNHTYEKSVHF